MANRITMLVIAEGIIVLISIMSVIIRPIIVTITAIMLSLIHIFAYRSLLKDERASDTALKEYTQRIINHTDMLMAAAKNEMKKTDK